MTSTAMKMFKILGSATLVFLVGSGGNQSVNNQLPPPAGVILSSFSVAVTGAVLEPGDVSGQAHL